MFGDVLKLDGSVVLRNSLAVSHVPSAMVFVQITVLIAEICFHEQTPIKAASAAQESFVGSNQR